MSPTEINIRIIKVNIIKVVQKAFIARYGLLILKCSIFLRVALTGPRSLAIYRLHPCSHWPIFESTAHLEEQCLSEMLNFVILVARFN